MKTLFTLFSLLLLSACHSTHLDPDGYSYKKEINKPVVNSENQLRVTISNGTMVFFGKHKNYWPEQFYISENEIKTITFYEKYQKVKTDNLSISVDVAYINGQLIFDSNPHNFKVQNWRIWLPHSYAKVQRFSKVSANNNFSVSDARNIYVKVMMDSF